MNIYRIFIRKVINTEIVEVGFNIDFRIIIKFNPCSKSFFSR